MPHTRYQAADHAVPLRRLPAAALRAVLAEGYGRAQLRADAMAGVVVGVVSLPLAMALAIGVGAPPQNGLYTAIVAGFIVAALGGSRTQVTGPTAAFIVILAPIYARAGMAGLLLSGLLGGLILILMGTLRLGRLIQFVPHPVTTGFTAGIAAVIATMQVKDLLGLDLPHPPENFLARVVAMAQAVPTASPWECAIGVATLAALIGVGRATRRAPAALIVLPAMAVVAAILRSLGSDDAVSTVASRFSTVVNGEVMHGVPQAAPSLLVPWAAPGPGGRPFEFTVKTLNDLLPGGFAIAMLGAIESLLSATIADGMAGTRHDPDAELIALGVGNVVTPFFGGVPATGAIARTATNVRSGARSPIAAMVHALTVFVAVIALAPLIGYLPMASLAALLLLVAWNMSELKHFGHILRVAPRSDVAVLLSCFGLTVFFDMVIAVTFGVVLSALLFMRRMAEVTQLRLLPEEPPVGDAHPPRGVVIYDISGPLFFGAAQRAMAALGARDDTRVVVLRMEHVPAIDATGLVALESALASLARRGVLVILIGVQPQPTKILQGAGIVERPGSLLVRTDLSEAWAELRSSHPHLFSRTLPPGGAEANSAAPVAPGSGAT